MNIDLEMAKSQEEATRRYSLHAKKDPYPEILPSLLNSADLIDYVKTTGMIHPFPIKGLNPVSYAVNILGEYVYWEDGGKKITGDLKKGMEITLKSNSIIFVTLEPYFQLPYYIAARFNFKLNNIYRGLLLGTGPVVDPGFCGRLSIPVHNLTTNSYVIRGGEQFIWMEFTKISHNDLWHTSKFNKNSRTGFYKEFDKKKNNRVVQDYMFDAESHRPIQSSIPTVAAKALKAAESAKRYTTIYTIASYAVLITILGIVFTIFYQSYNLINNTKNDIDLKYKNHLTEINQQLEQAKIDIDSLKLKYNHNKIKNAAKKSN